MSAIVKYEAPPEKRGELLPALSLTGAIERRNAIVELMKHEIMEENRDYGKIPGTDKPTLLKPGAEKLATLFGLHVERPEIVEKEQDWTGKDHNGEAFFYYLVCQQLTRNGVAVAAQMGSCNSWEKKYRYRSSERKCPQCGAAAIKRSKYPPRENPSASPGWYCFSKAGGCGANFDADDPDITAQQTGRIPNPDVADQVNSILKMAQKRALVAAVLVATNASEFFTQDVEDMEIIEADYEVKTLTQPQEEQKPAKAEQTKKTPSKTNLFHHLCRKDSELTRAGLCDKGDLLNYLSRVGAQEGFGAKLEAWQGNKAIEYAGKCIKNFEEFARRPCAPDRQKQIDTLFNQLEQTVEQRDEFLKERGVAQGEIMTERRARQIIDELKKLVEIVRMANAPGARQPGDEPGEEIPY